MADDEDAPDPWGAPSFLSARNNFVDAPRANRLPHATKKRVSRTFRTGGRLPPGRPAVVYAAGGDGWVKIGMTTDVATREASLGARIRFVLPVVPDAAKDVEAAALSRLGRAADMPGEWVNATLAEAEAALQAAWHSVARYRRVDPDISEDEARLARIRACAPAPV